MSLPTPLNWLHQGVGSSQGFYAVGTAITAGVNSEPFEIESDAMKSGAAVMLIHQFRGWRFFADEYSANEYAQKVVLGRNNDWNEEGSTVEVKKLKVKNKGPLMFKKDGRSKAKPLFGPLTNSYYVSKWGLKPEGYGRYINQVMVLRIELDSKTWSEKDFGPYY
jgi:hypothetical protein